LNCTRNQDPSVEFTKQLKVTGASESDQGRRVRNDDHELRRSSVRRSSSRSEAL
jgi:hypothetical protein